MNQKQLLYHLGWLKDQPEIMAVPSLSLGLYYLCEISPHLTQNVGLGAISLAALLISGRCLKKYLPKKVALWRDQAAARRNRGLFPLEFAERICIEDRKGLEHLLERTAQGEKYEWGTIFKACSYKDVKDKNAAVIYQIMDSRDAELQGFVSGKQKKRLQIDTLKLEAAGYNGRHHYHPTYNACNYSINAGDRNFLFDGLQLLTFSLPEGPEVIGFNHQFTYIPSDKTKRELLKANYKQIMEYLGCSK